MNEVLPPIILDIISLIKNNNLRESVNLITRSIEIDPRNLDYLFNIGVDYAECGKINDAITIFDCLQLCRIYDSRISYSLGYLHALKHDYQKALLNFHDAFKINPNDLATLINYASTLHELKKFDDALIFFDKALRLDPNSAQALTNKGVTLLELKLYDEALAHHDKALGIERQNHIIWANKASLFKQLKQYEQSANCYLKAAELCIDESYFIGEAHHQMMLTCDWTNYEYITNLIFNRISLHNKTAEPFGLQGIANSEDLLQKCAEIYSNDKYPELGSLAKNSKYKHKKIRIGYLCGEFREHATSILMTRIWELHDKERFKIFAFDSGYNDNSEYRKRICSAFDDILDISQLSDLDAANLIQSNEIDILINLNGFFGYERMGVFSYKPSPIQVNFLGFPGTLGASYIDYIIADNTVIPEGSRKYYTEKIICLPNTYQANDNLRKISDRVFSRSQLGLPGDAFVFACFNNSYKITPLIFDSWMRILGSVQGSVLWLITDTSIAKNNLIKEAAARGIDASRLIFAERLPISEHLARHDLADLFLDTLPYNAHTTCSDALWAGLPVLTLMGDTFPGRVSSSLLRAVGLSELITNTQNEYEVMAIELATNPKKLLAIREKLVKNYLVTPLFDSALFTKNLESAYFKMHAQYQAGLRPEHIFIT